MNFHKMASKVAVLFQPPGDTWVVTLEDFQEGDIIVTYPDQTYAHDVGDDKVINRLKDEVKPHDIIKFVRGYEPYGEYETTGAEFKKNIDQYRSGGLWGF